MGLLGDLVVRVVGDTKDFVHKVDQAGRKMSQFDRDMKKIAKNMVKVGKSLTKFVTLPILALGVGFVKAASDAEETNSKFNAVFKEQAESVRSWADDFADATGRSQTATVGFLASIQDLFVPLGASRSAAADFAKQVVTLATDMSSFNNIPTATVMRDIESSLVGNYETTRKYGVVLSAAKIQQEAFNRGLAQEGEVLTPLIKAQVALQLITEGTADAQGDAVRTAGSMANQFVALKSAVTDLAISFGNKLIPLTQVLVGHAKDIVKWFTDLDSATKKIILVVGGLAAAIGPLLLVVGTLIIKMIALNATMIANPAIGLALAIAAVVAGLVAVTAGIIVTIRSNREYKELLTNTAEAVRDLNNEERELAKARLIEDRFTLRRQRAREQDALAAIEAEQAVMAQNERLSENIVLNAGLENRHAAVSEAIAETTGEIQELTDAIFVINEAIDEEIRVTEEAEQSAADLAAAQAEVEAAALASEEAARLLVLALEAEADAAEAAAKRERALAHERLLSHIALRNSLLEAQRLRDEANRKALEAYRIQQEEIARLAEEETVRLEEEAATLAAKLAAAERARNQDRELAGIALRNRIYEDARLHNERMAALLEEYLDKDDDVTEEIVEHWSVVFGRIGNIAASFTDILGSLAEKRADDRINALDKELLGEEAFDAAVRKIRREEAIASKQLAVFDATLSGIVAVANALKTLNPLIIAAAIAKGLAQVVAAGVTRIPALAQGGIVTGPTPAMVGEGGQPEIIFPLDQLGDFLSSRGNFDDVGGGATSVTVNLDGAQILKYVGKATDDGRLLINQRAVV